MPPLLFRPRRQAARAADFPVDKRGALWYKYPTYYVSSKHGQGGACCGTRAPLRQAASGRATATNSRPSFYRHLWILHKIRLLFLSLIAAEKYLTHVVFDVTLQSAAILTGFVNRYLLRQSSEQIPTGRRIPPTDETTDKQKEATKCLM